MWTLPITAMLEEIQWISDYVCIARIQEIEEAQQKKAKEEERERIVSIISTHRWYIPRDVFFEIQEAITNISNNQ